MLATALTLLAAATLSPLYGAPARDPAPAEKPLAAKQAAIRVVLPPPGRRLPLPLIAGPSDARRPLVVLDPGHGGVDRGAMESDGQDEKSLALGLATALRDELVARGRFRVALTRNGDRLLTLEERTGIAGKLGADLFLSIHLASENSPGERGLSIYTQADRASDPIAQRRAAAENGVDRSRDKVLGRQPLAVNHDARQLSRQQVRDRSAVFANLVIRQARGRVRLNARPRRQAPLAVLAGVSAPAVLVEAGSIGDPDDSKALGSAAGRARFAQVAAEAMETYFARLPPER